MVDNEELIIQKRKDLLNKYNLIYTKRIWNNKIKIIKNSANYDNNKTELENMKIYLDYMKDFENYRDTLKRGEYAFHCKIHGFYKGTSSKQQCQKCR